MKNIKSFIESFIASEYKCNKGEYDFSLSDQNYESLRKEAAGFFHSYVGENFWRGVEESDLEDMDEEEKEGYQETFLSVIPRELFQIKQYKNFELGDTLRRIVTGDDLYACYTSYESDNGMPLDYSDMFYIAKTDEGLKIIYQMRYGVRDRQWRHSHDLEVLQVINNGELVAVEKYQPPVEATSLADYNKE